MDDGREVLRFASPNEQRTISREDVGFYHAVIVGAVYEVGDAIDTRSPSLFFHPLSCCIEQNPYLSVIVNHMDTDKSQFVRVARIDLLEHISIVNRPADKDSWAEIADVLASDLDKPFPRNRPPWRIVVLPSQQGCFIAFSYSHMIGDGPTGGTFHRTFLRAWTAKDAFQPAPQVIDIPKRPFPAPFDTPERLAISWSFMLRPLLAAVILPSWISKWLGLASSVASIDAGTWTAGTIFFDPSTSHSRLKLCRISAPVLAGALRATRMHSAKLTGTLQVIISRALSKTLPEGAVTNFFAQTAINMRNAVAVTHDEGGDWVSGCHSAYPRSAHPFGELSAQDWANAKETTENLSIAAATLQNQSIGLLRYLPSIRRWTQGKIGQRRDCSFEVSNIGVFDASDIASSFKSKITEMVFAQPGQVISAPLAFNFVSVKGGSLVFTVTWQAGALALGEMDEERFVDGVCLSIEEDLAAL